MKIWIAMIFWVAATKLPAQQNDSLFLRKMNMEIMQHSQAYQNLHTLCKEIGPRLSGSSNADRAVIAAAAMMRKAGADTVYLQPCWVPKWERGSREIATIFDGSKKRSLQVCALGMSVGTGEVGLTAPIVSVKSFEELTKLGEEAVRGKIVFFNYAMRPELIFNGYGDAVRYRGSGAVVAAHKGAIAVLVRSITHAQDDYPHTGTTRYVDSIKKIPAFAVSTNDADWLFEHLKKSPNATLYLQSTCKTWPDVLSYNVIGEIRGETLPEEIVLTGGHLDSWDLAEGAHDDGAGCVQSIEVLRAIKAMGQRPTRTIRSVLFMNEENGLKGALAYADSAKAKGEKHLFAIESDAGGFGVQTIGIKVTGTQLEKARQWQPLLAPYGILAITENGDGADIGPLKSQGTIVASINPHSQRYFDHHHAANDLFESVNKRELELGAFGMAAICWLVSRYGL